jgi:hypothetical protein
LGGVARLPESTVFYRDVDTMEWYPVIDKEYIVNSRNWTREELQAHNEKNLFPLHDLMSKRDCYIIHGSAIRTGGGEGIIASLIPPKETIAGPKLLDGIPVRIQCHILFAPANPAQTKFQNTIKALAIKLRNDDLTDRLSNFNQRDTIEAKAEYDAILKSLKKKMKNMMRQAIVENEDLGAAIDSIHGGEMREMAWVFIGDWYYNDLKASRMPDDQIWYVD